MTYAIGTFVWALCAFTCCVQCVREYGEVSGIDLVVALLLGPILLSLYVAAAVIVWTGDITIYKRKLQHDPKYLSGANKPGSPHWDDR